MPETNVTDGWKEPPDVHLGCDPATIVATDAPREGPLAELELEAVRRSLISDARRLGGYDDVIQVLCGRQAEPNHHDGKSA